MSGTGGDQLLPAVLDLAGEGDIPVILALNVKENKTQVTSNGLGQHLKIVDNNQDGVAEYVLQTKYTVAIMAAKSRCYKWCCRPCR